MESSYEEPSPCEDDGGPLSLTAYDSNSCLLTIGSGGVIRLRDIRQELISGEWSREVATPDRGSTKLSGSRALRPQPELGVRAVQLSVSHDGAYAAAAGTSVEDPDQAAVSVLDLTFRRPAARDGTGAERCESAQVDEEHFRSRPGLRVLQMAWHPGSSTHLAVLTSDNSWQLYHAGNLSHPEQRFELRLQRRRGVGVDGGEGRRAVAFAFGPQHSWQRFTVYFLCSDGAVFALCPVACFGAGVPASAVQALSEATAENDDLAHSGTTKAWLQQALSGPPVQGSLGVGGVSVQRLALDEHVPGLCGPLGVACAEGTAASFLEWAQEDDEAVSLCINWFGGAATVLAVASARGLLGLHLLAEDIFPTWAESAPLCLTDDTLLLGVRSEVPVVDEAPPGLLLLDLVDLQSQAASRGAPDGEHTGRVAMHLLPDEAAPERLFVRTQSAAWAVTLSWLPALAKFLAEDREALEEVAQLPPPRVEQLFTAQPGSTLTGACVVGDALSGTALVLLTSDGDHHCLRPSGSLPADQQPRSEQRDAAAREVEEQVQQLYGALLRGPKGQRQSEGRALAVSSPEGTKALGEGIRSLLERHVEFIHQGHHHLLPRVEELKAAGEAQLHQLERMTDLHAAVQHSQDTLVARLDRASKLHANLQSRVKLLAELHFQLPRPLSLAEARMRDVVIPDAEAALTDLQRSVQSARRRWAALGSKAQQKAAAPMTSSVTSPSVPAAQLRRVRAALAEQAALTASASRGLATMQAWLQAWQQEAQY